MAKKARSQSNEPVNWELRLQARLLLRDQHGKVIDVTHEKGRGEYGVEGLKDRSARASDALIRVNELLKLLSFAAENRDEIDACLVQPVLQDVEMELSRVGELGCFIDYVEDLFGNAEGLPLIRKVPSEASSRVTDRKTSGHSLTYLKAVS